jgi:hypothetical protein
LNHLSKRSWADSNHKLEEPSHMKSKGVDALLKHWLKLQKKSKCPLVLRGPADQSPKLRQGPNNVSKQKTGKGKGKAHYIESEDSDDEETEDRSDTGRVNEGNTELSVRHTGQSNERAPDDVMLLLPPSPLSVSKNRKTHHAFLRSLSNDDNYKKLLLLLRAAKVSERYSHLH